LHPAVAVERRVPAAPAWRQLAAAARGPARLSAPREASAALAAAVPWGARDAAVRLRVVAQRAAAAQPGGAARRAAVLPEGAREVAALAVAALAVALRRVAARDAAEVRPPGAAVRVGVAGLLPEVAAPAAAAALPWAALPSAAASACRPGQAPLLLARLRRVRIARARGRL